MNTAVINFQTMISRAVTICAAAVPGSEKFDTWLTSNESCPFFVGKIGTIDVGKDSDDIDGYTVAIVVRHIVGNRTEGVPGEVEAKLYVQMPAVLAALQSEDVLQSETDFDEDEDGDEEDYSEPPDWFEEIERVTCVGLAVYDAKGIGATSDQIGTEYTITGRVRANNQQIFE